MPPLIDGHLDIAMNALWYDRDQTQSIGVLRSAEEGVREPGRGLATVSLPELRRARVAVAVGTLFARAKPGTPTKTRLLRSDADFATQNLAHAAARGQLGYYRLLEEQRFAVVIENTRQLAGVWERRDEAAAPLGVIVAIECADSIVEPEQARRWWDLGVRVVGLAHFGPGTYAHGTVGASDTDGPLTPRGRLLLPELQRLGFALDLTHLSDTSLAEALDLFAGRVLASHSNCRALCPGSRQLSDEQLRRIIDRKGVVGCAIHNAMLDPNWKHGGADRNAVSLDWLANHIDHVCQLAGNAHHAAIGSDMDGGYGAELCPREVDTIADVQRIAELLSNRGYGDDAIALVCHGNWLRFYSEVLPA